MELNHFGIKIFFLAISALLVNGSRKYDIEAEARSIYGTDLKSVLQKFRHSPAYMKILDERMTDITYQFMHMLSQLVFFYTNEMKTKILKTLKPGEDVEKLRQKLLLRSKYYPLRSRLRQAEEETDAPPVTEEVTRKPNEILDAYVAIRRKLPASYLNHFRGMGYEYYGRALHGLVKNLGGDAGDPEARSTQGGDGPDFMTTTEHVTLHTATTPSDMTPFIVSSLPDDEEEITPAATEAEP